MTTTYKELLTNNQSITATGLASLANGSAYALAAVDNTVNQDYGAGLQVKIKTAGSGTSTTGYVNVYAAGSSDGGTTWPEGIAGSAGSLTLISPTNLKLIGRFSAVATATTYISNVFPVESAFGYLPGKWVIVIENQSGGAFDSTGANFSIVYERVQGQS